jgi:hypothetical protein
VKDVHETMDLNRGISILRRCSRLMMMVGYVRIDTSNGTGTRCRDKGGVIVHIIVYRQ